MKFDQPPLPLGLNFSAPPRLNETAAAINVGESQFQKHLNLELISFFKSDLEN